MLGSGFLGFRAYKVYGFRVLGSGFMDLGFRVECFLFFCDVMGSTDVGFGPVR